MRKLILVLVAALLVLPTTAAAMSPARRHVHCQYLSSGHTMEWTKWKVKTTLDCVIDHNPSISRSKAFYIADRESHFYAYARNTSSGACGIYQHMPRYWPERAAAHGFAGASCFNARANIFVTIRMVRISGWGPWGG